MPAPTERRPSSARRGATPRRATSAPAYATPVKTLISSRYVTGEAWTTPCLSTTVYAAIAHAIVTASSAPRARATPRTSRIPAATISTPATWRGVVDAPVRATAPPSTSTGASPRASGYTTDSSARVYAKASSAKYASSSTDVAARNGHTPLSSRQPIAATGAPTTAPTSSTTAANACESRAPASNMFHTAWITAAASARTRASAGSALPSDRRFEHGTVVLELRRRETGDLAGVVVAPEAHRVRRIGRRVEDR